MGKARRNEKYNKNMSRPFGNPTKAENRKTK